MSYPGRGSLSARRAASWKPTQLSGCVLWLDAMESGSYTLTPGTGGQLDTVGSITNLASGVAWTEATNPPLWERPGGAWDWRPCLRGDGVARRLMSTEAAVLAAFNGSDHSFTLAMVVEPLSSQGTNMYFGLADSATNVVQSRQLFMNRQAGLYRYERTDDLAATTSTNCIRLIQPGPHLVVFRFSSAAPTQIEIYVDDDPVPEIRSISDVQTITSTRAALFCIPDLTPDSFLNGRIGFAAGFDSALAAADLATLRSWGMARWIESTVRLNQIANNTIWLQDEVFTGGNNITAWGDKNNVQDWSAPAGAEPLWLQAIDPIGAMTFQGTDALHNSTAFATSAVTVALKFKLDQLPALGSAFTLASPRMGTDKWFQILAVNGSASYNDWTFSFHGVVGSADVFGIDLETLDGGIHSLVITYDGSGSSPSDYQVWLDGVQKTITKKGSISRTTGDKGSLGAFVSSADVLSNPMIGKLYEFAVWDRVLNAAEIAGVNERLLDGWSFEPGALTNRKLHFDLKDATSYQVSTGKVDSIRNKATGVLWTEATNPPDYEAAAFLGSPCMKFDGVDDVLMSTEAAVFGAVDGEDASFTSYLVMQPLTIGGATQTWVGFGNSGFATDRTVVIGDDTGGDHIITKRDDAGGLDDAQTGPVAPRNQHVSAWSIAGVTATGYVNDGTVITSAGLNVGVTTPNRTAFGCRPDSAPDQFGNYRLAEALIYEGAHSEADARAFARHFTSKYSLPFNPITISSLVAWFDMLESSSWTESGGTITSIRNLASNTAWNTAATAFPLYEATGFGGLPCMRGESSASGGSTNRGLISTEAAVASVFSGADTPWTIIAVTEPVTITGATSAVIFGAGNSGVSSNQQTYIHRRADNGNYQVVKIDDAAASVSSSSLDEGSGRRVMTWVVPGTTLSTYNNLTQVQSAVALDVGTVTPNRSAFFCRPDSGPDTFGVDRIAELFVFNRAIGDIERRLLTASRMTKWGIT